MTGKGECGFSKTSFIVPVGLRRKPTHVKAQCSFAGLFLPICAASPQSSGMKTLAKPARKTARALVKKPRRAYVPVKNLPPGAIKLADWEIELMNKTPSYGPGV